MTTNLQKVGNFLGNIRYILRQIDGFAPRQRDAVKRLEGERDEALKTPFGKAKAERLQWIIDCTRKQIQSDYKKRIEAGSWIVSQSSYVDSITTPAERLMLCNVNQADAKDLPEDAGIIDILYIYALGDSAEHRGQDFGGCVLRNALIAYYTDVMISTPELQQKTHDFMFGKGGMFEFLPTYRREPDGSFVRNPPKLRVADACDAG